MGLATVENLESRVLCSAGVTLTRVGGTARALVPGRQTWVIIHGLGGTKDDAGIRAMAAAVDGISSKDQVLIADWHTLAQTDLTDKATNRNLQAAADALAVRIRRVGPSAKARQTVPKRATSRAGAKRTSKWADPPPPGHGCGRLSWHHAAEAQ